MPNTDFQNGVIIATVAGGTEIGITPTGNIDITKNGEYDVTAYETATVNVAGGGEMNTKTTISKKYQSIVFALPTQTTISIQ